MKRAVVTGAFSNIGAAAAEALEGAGFAIHTLTNRTPPSGTRWTSAPLCFDREHLVEQLRETDVFVNTYWVRLPHAGQDFETAVADNRMLVEAAGAAGVRRYVHVSVSNPERGTNLGYYGGKARVEEYLRESGLSWGVVRPTLVVSTKDVLSNNIAWFLRHFPVFPMPRGGTCRLQPVTLADTARIIRDTALSSESSIVDAAGPEVMTFREYVGLLAEACGVERWMPSTPNWVSLLGIRLVEPFLSDRVLTKEELLGLQQELLLSHEPPTGTESVSRWLREHGSVLGARYVNDMHRHFGKDRKAPIQS